MMVSTKGVFYTAHSPKSESPYMILFCVMEVLGWRLTTEVKKGLTGAREARNF